MSGPTGKRTVKTDPLPTSLATVTSPPIMRASLREMAERFCGRTERQLMAVRSGSKPRELLGGMSLGGSSVAIMPRSEADEKVPGYFRGLSAARGRARISSIFSSLVGSFPCRYAFKK